MWLTVFVGATALFFARFYYDFCNDCVCWAYKSNCEKCPGCKAKGVPGVYNRPKPNPLDILAGALSEVC